MKKLILTLLSVVGSNIYAMEKAKEEKPRVVTTPTTVETKIGRNYRLAQEAREARKERERRKRQASEENIEELVHGSSPTVVLSEGPGVPLVAEELPEEPEIVYTSDDIAQFLANVNLGEQEEVQPLLERLIEAYHQIRRTIGNVALEDLRYHTKGLLQLLTLIEQGPVEDQNVLTENLRLCLLALSESYARYAEKRPNLVSQELIAELRKLIDNKEQIDPTVYQRKVFIYSTIAEAVVPALTNVEHARESGQINRMLTSL